MTETTSTFTTGDGVPLFTRTWTPEETARAVLAVVHGVSEHSGRYRELAGALTRVGFSIAAFDLRGHGQSGGPRGHVSVWRDYVVDVAAFLNQLRAQHVGRPLFLLGHSLGSLITLALVMEQPDLVSGLIVSGTAVDPVGVARPHLVVLARLFSRVWPTFPVRIQSPIRPKLSRIPAVEEAFLADPLVLKRVTARFGTEALKLIEVVKEGAPRVTTPLLALHGGADPLNSLAGAQSYFERVASRDKRLIVYPGSLHEVHHDLDQARLFADLEEWISRRL